MQQVINIRATLRGLSVGEKIVLQGKGTTIRQSASVLKENEGRVLSVRKVSSGFYEICRIR